MVIFVKGEKRSNGTETIWRNIITNFHKFIENIKPHSKDFWTTRIIDINTKKDHKDIHHNKTTDTTKIQSYRYRYKENNKCIQKENMLHSNARKRLMANPSK